MVRPLAQLRWRAWLAHPIPWLLCAVAAVHGVILQFSFVNWDDRKYVLSNVVTRWASEPWSVRLLTPELGYPVPLPVTLYALNDAWLGGEAGVLHALSLLLHATNAVLAYSVVRNVLARFEAPDPLGRLAGATARHEAPDPRWAAAFAAALWALHPITAEPVAWVTALKDLGLGAGTLLAMRAALAQRRAVRLGLIALGALLAFGSKPTAIVIGPLLIVVAWMVHVRGSPERREVTLAGVVLALFGLGYVAMTYGIHERFGGHAPDRDVLGRVTGALVMQVRHYVAPVGLGPNYPYTPPGAAMGATALALVGILAFAAVRARRNAPLVTLGVAWMAATYVPVSNILSLSRWVGDSYLYLPSLGAAMAITAGARTLVGRIQVRRAAVIATAVAALLLLSVGTRRQLAVWRNGVTLWSHACTLHPELALPAVHLGEALYIYGQYEQALGQFRRASGAYNEALPFPSAWPRAVAELGDVERAHALFVDAIQQGPRRTSARPEREWKLLVKKYGGFLAEHGLEPHPSLRPSAARIARRAKESEAAR